MLKLWQHDKNRPARNRTLDRTVEPIWCEPLEPRLLLNADCPVIQDVSTDNRGFVVMRASHDIMISTINFLSVRVFTAGPDGLLGTADDQLQSSTASYDPTTREIRVDAKLPVDTRYRVFLDASIIRATNGRFLDGEFNGVGVDSGDGVEGGNFEIFTRRSLSTIARFTTVAGIIDVELFPDRTPLTVQNFLNYANRGAWDNTFFHRSASLEGGDPFVIQGGGFTANSNLAAIPQDPAVLNEPGIPNTRGTIAMAKLGGNPNSATNQWFFNLGDNRSILDQQNGGFTVFGEIIDASGLTIMDDIAGFDVVNASGQGGAFNEVPVLDPQAVTDRGGMVIPSDLIVVSRVAILMDFSGVPFDQLDTTGSVLINQPNGDVSVRFFDLDGVGLPTDGSFFNIVYNGRDRIERIVLLDPFPNARIGIQILDARSVGAIVDNRKSPGAEISFIVSDASINNIRINGSIVGMNLNGFVLPGGLIIDEDVDRDGDVSDPLAIYAPNGHINHIRVNGDLTGSIVVFGGLSTLTIGGVARDADVLIENAPTVGTRFNFARVEDTSITTDGPITVLRATDWQSVQGGAMRISATSINALNITGDRRNGLDGDFAASITLSGAADPLLTLGRAKISGSLLISDWNIGGDAGPIQVRGDISQSRISIDGDLPRIVTNRILSSDILITGRLNSLRAVDYNSGTFRADSLQSIVMRGDRRNDIPGNLEAEVEIFNSADERFGLAVLNVNGSLTGGFFGVMGDVRRMVIKGDVTDAEISLVGGGINLFRAGIVTESIFIADGATQRMTFTRWDGGQLQGSEFGRIQSLGDRRLDLNGDIRADITTNVLGTLITGRQGNLETNLTVRTADLINIGGDLVRSTLLQQVNIGDLIGYNTITIGGSMRDSTLHSRSSINSISMKGMYESGIYVGIGANTGFFGLPDTSAGITTSIRLDSIRITGFGANERSMFNSFIVAGQLGSALINFPETNNFGRPFGIATSSINSVETRFDSGRVRLGPNASTPAPQGDYQVRLNFTPPAIA